ncbi:hypothetical protein COE15_07900, partial [Bacillus cereus]|uniref:hypothetical protein n=2 Tax=unclassified Bacillus (in: firmicutes) TaxID=185979 RepID=UPI000BFAF6A1
MTENKQQKRLIFLLTVVLVAVFICVSFQNKKTNSNKSNNHVADVREDKNSEKSSKSDFSNVKVTNNVSDQSLKEKLSNSEDEGNISKQSIEIDHASDLPQNKNYRDSSEKIFSTEVHKEATFVKLGKKDSDNDHTLNNMNNLIQPVQVSEAYEKEKQIEA